MAVSPDEIYTDIGRAISAWAEFEERLFHLFCFLMNQEEDICAAVFFVWRDFSSRLRLVHDVYTKKREPEPEADYWRGLHSATNNLSAERNFIAHNYVAILLKGEPQPGIPLHKQGEPGLITGPLDHIHRRKELITKTPKDIKKLTEAFHHLRMTYSAFLLHLNGQFPSPDRFHGPLRDLPLATYDSWSRQQPRLRHLLPPSPE